MALFGIYAPNKQKAMEWVAALSAEGIRHKLGRNAERWILWVPEELGQRAKEAIEGYEKDNIDWPPKPLLKSVDLPPSRDAWVAFGMALVLALFFIRLGPYSPESNVLTSASANSEAIRGGEWWRAFTALTIHSDFPHLAGNMIFLSLLGYFACRLMGGGLGGLLILLSGAFGNALVAWLYKESHNAVGASTACFGALGLLSMQQAITIMRQDGNWRSVWARVWLPFGGAIALLSFTGTSPGSDLAAHLFGFLCGLVLAVPASLTGTSRIPLWAHRILELASLLLLFGAWWMVFENSA